MNEYGKQVKKQMEDYKDSPGITKEIHDIQNADVGVKVRGALASGLKKAYDDASKNGNANMEVEMARGVYPTLGDRLDEQDGELRYHEDVLYNHKLELEKKADLNDLLSKRDKSVPININDFDGETLSLIEGSAGDTPIEILSIPRDHSVTPTKTTFLVQGKNLFDPAKRELGRVLDSIGTLGSHPDYDTTDFIFVSDGDYAITECRHIAIYDEDKVFLRHINVPDLSKQVISVAENGFIRVSFPKRFIDTSMIERGSIHTKYEPYQFDVSNQIRVNLDNVYGELAIEKVSFLERKNLFNPKNRLIDHALNTNGNPQQTEQSVGYSVSDFISVTPDQYAISRCRSMAIYDASQNLIEFIDMQGIYPTVVEIGQPGYIRVTFSEKDINSSMVSRGGNQQNYIPYDGYVFPSNIYINDSNIITSSNSKKIKGVHFGDSITANGTLVEKISSITGYDTFNAGVGGTRLIDIDVPENPLTVLSMCNIAEALTSNDWAKIDNALSSLNDSVVTDRINKLKDIDFSKIDYIALMFGTNDINGSTVALGEANSIDRSTINGAMNYVLSTIMGHFPNLRVFVFAPIYRPQMPGSNPTEDSDNFSRSDIYLYDIANTMGDRAKDYKIPFKNTYYECGINKYNWTQYIDDGTHPNEAGDELLAQVIGNFLTSN